MKSITKKFEVNREDYTDKGWSKYLTKVLDKAKLYNYYELMDVTMDKTIDEKALSTTFRNLAKWLHPDKNIDKPYTDVATELFKLILNAYETLKDSKKEQIYRMTQTTPGSNTDSQPSPKPQTTRTYSTTSKPEDFDFSSFLSGFPGPKVYVKKTTASYSSNGNVFFNSEAEKDKIIEGDVSASEMIKTKSGNIIVKGNVFGKVNSMSGDITVHGFVSGTVETMSGDNHIHSGIKAGGNVKTMSGDNHIRGEVQGKYSTMTGKNIINDECSSQKTRGTTYTVYYN